MCNFSLQHSVVVGEQFRLLFCLFRFFCGTVSMTIKGFLCFSLHIANPCFELQVLQEIWITCFNFWNCTQFLMGHSKSILTHSSLELVSWIANGVFFEWFLLFPQNDISETSIVWFSVSSRLCFLYTHKWADSTDPTSMSCGTWKEKQIDGLCWLCILHSSYSKKCEKNR